MPVLLLLDVSGSMAEDGKLAALNTAVREMLHAFSQERAGGAEIHVAVLAFGGRAARVHLPLTPAREVKFEILNASGHTPLGSALQLAERILENRELIPGRAYRPTVVLVSDGVPTDDWEEPLRAFLAAPRASRAVRLALAVGEDADLEVLTLFAGEDHVRKSSEARQLRRFFKFVTSVPDNLGLTLSRTGEFPRLVFSLRCEREKAGVLKMCKLQPPPLPTVANSPYTSKPWCQPCVSTRFSASW
ncbi:vWA domain-containing protein, partial [Deinococcus xinjiangensis]|uniref:vWA domain-containing protein n=1 Tax=Deinococcus xinjiangensis TaxID=457454 RepID=UPI003365A3B6